MLPSGWRERLVRVHSPATAGATGLCLETHDIAVSKLVAGREKDTEYVGALLRHRLVRPETLTERLAATPVDAQRRAAAEATLRRLVSRAG